MKINIDAICDATRAAADALVEMREEIMERRNRLISSTFLGRCFSDSIGDDGFPNGFAERFRNKKVYMLAGKIRPSAIYFLFKDHRMIYIGQSVNVFHRLTTHNIRHDFSIYAPCEEADLGIVESALIRMYMPPENRTGNVLKS